jgi:hypothetical protein
MTSVLYGLTIRSDFRLKRRSRKLPNYGSSAWTELQSRGGQSIATLQVDLVDKFRRRLAALKRIKKWHKARRSSMSL